MDRLSLQGLVNGLRDRLAASRKRERELTRQLVDSARAAGSTMSSKPKSRRRRRAPAAKPGSISLVIIPSAGDGEGSDPEAAGAESGRSERWSVFRDSSTKAASAVDQGANYDDVLADPGARVRRRPVPRLPTARLAADRSDLRALGRRLASQLREAHKRIASLQDELSVRGAVRGAPLASRP